jgi:hypothetical protein
MKGCVHRWGWWTTVGSAPSFGERLQQVAVPSGWVTHAPSRCIDYAHELSLLLVFARTQWCLLPACGLPCALCLTSRPSYLLHTTQPQTLHTSSCTPACRRTHEKFEISTKEPWNPIKVDVTKSGEPRCDRLLASPYAGGWLNPQLCTCCEQRCVTVNVCVGHIPFKALSTMVPCHKRGRTLQPSMAN